MAKKFAPVAMLGSSNEPNWRAAVGDLLSKDDVSGVIITAFFKDRSFMIRRVTVSQSETALIGAALSKLATDDIIEE